LRIVLDTNVLLSGLFFGGIPLRIVKACLLGTVHLVASTEILQEYREAVLDLARRNPLPSIARLLDMVFASASVVRPAPLDHPVCRDADDDKFIACALAANADFIVSGDRDLHSIPASVGVAVLSPRRFVTEHLQGRA